MSINAAAAAKSLQSCPTLCDHIDSNPPGSTIPGILQARTLEWIAISFSNAWKWKVTVKSLSPTLSNPVDCSLPGSSIHGIFQARVLEWGAIAFSTIDEWIKKLWYIFTMEYYSAIKRNTFESVLMRWMNLEIIIHSEVSQKEKDKYHTLMHIHRI